LIGATGVGEKILKHKSFYYRGKSAHREKEGTKNMIL
jgi:hypothetical protein